jgi:hypothetical protein
MFVAKLRFAAALLVALGLIAGVGVLASRGASGGPPATAGPAAGEEGTPEKPGEDCGPEVPWGETVDGWRMRLTTPSGTEYRWNTPLPLLLEVQNASEGLLALESLGWWNPDPEVTADGKRLVARPLIDVSPWEGRRDDLPAGASIKRAVDFERLRFSGEPVKAGAAVRVRFRLSLPGKAPKGAPGAAAAPRLFSNEVSLKLKDDHPSVMAGEADLPPKWADSTELVYQEHAPLMGYSALRIDGAGRAWLVTVGRGKGQAGPAGPVRTEAVLGRDRLDQLARFLRDQKVWELADLSQADIAFPDEGEIRLSLGAGRGSLVGSFPDHSVRGQPKLLALKAEMAKVMALVREEAAAKAPVGEPLWGTPRNGLRLGLCRAEAEADGKVRLPVVLDNVGTADLVVNLGVVLGNGKKQVPLAVRLLFTDAEGKEYTLRRNEPGVAGRVDPLVVPLAACNRYTISCDLEEWRAQLAPGPYRVRGEFEGNAVTRKEVNADTTGLALMTYWTGTIQSDECRVTLPARPGK